MAYEYVIKTIFFCKIRAPWMWSPGVQGQFTYSSPKIWPRICSDKEKLIYVGKFVVHEFDPRKCRDIFTYKFLTHLLAAYMLENGYWLNRATSWHVRWWFWGLLLQSQQQHQPQWSPWQHAVERDFSWERAIILHSPNRGYVNWCASGHELGPRGTRISSSVVRFLPSGLAVRQSYEVPKCNVIQVCFVTWRSPSSSKAVTTLIKTGQREHLIIIVIIIM